MVDKNQINRIRDRIKAVKTWQLIIILILGVFVSATMLRLNNIKMVHLREAVLTSDKTADTVQIQNRLIELQKYSSTHMNANTGTFYLDGQYKADVERAVTAAGQTGTPNAIAAADAACKSRFSGYSMAYTLCIEQEQSKFPPSQTVQPQLPNPLLYRKEFSSPLLSFDLAGASVIFCIFICCVIVFRLISLAILKRLLKKHYTNL